MTDEYCVVIPAHNSDRFIAATLASVHGQTRAPQDVIVVDDGSTDRTVEIAAEAGARVVSTSGQHGPSVARNLGVHSTSAPLIAFLDADDEWLPEHAATLLPAFDDVATAFVGSNAEKFGSELGTIGPRKGAVHAADVRDLLISENPVIQSSAIVRRDAFMTAGGYDESMRFSEDYDLWTRVAETGEFRHVNSTTVRRRMHAGQVTQRFRTELVHAWWTVRRRTVARRLRVASQFERSRVLQLLDQSAKLDIEWAIWTGDSTMLSIVRDEIRITDDELHLGTRLSTVGGLSHPALRLSQDVRCGSRSLLQFIQGQR
ncbi:MAG: glycosyltransferase family 2 protein [Gemmatimonadaceae bacterium]|nr:glycosyltransferase family 2 protein [Gemmatimonadaceae bacterium]